MTISLKASSDGLSGTLQVGGVDKATIDNNGKFTATSFGGDGALLTGLIKSGATVAATSGTSIDFTGIPSWAKRITVMFNGVSVSGTSLMQIQLGDSGGIENSGYLAFASFCSTVASTASFTAGFGTMTAGLASEAFSGAVVFVLMDSATNLWVAQGNLARTTGGAGVALISGSKATSGVLDRVRITTVNGTDTFDAGSINILYE